MSTGVGNDNPPGEASIQESKSFQIALQGDQFIQCRRYKDSTKPPKMIFTHGAGGTLDAPAMLNFAAGFATTGPLLYFQGSMNLKSRTKMFHTVLEHETGCKALGGRSMGSRAAVMTAHDFPDIKALVLVSYPLKNEKGDIRDQILLELGDDVDVLFICGDRDEMCDLDELKRVRQKMRSRSWLITVQGADHGMNMKPKKATDAIGRLNGQMAVKWLEERGSKTECSIGWNNDSGSESQSPWGTDASTITNIISAKDSRTKSSCGPKKFPGPEEVQTRPKAPVRKSKVSGAIQADHVAPTTRETRSQKRKRSLRLLEEQFTKGKKT